jgi:hypothetical protein
MDEIVELLKARLCRSGWQRTVLLLFLGYEWGGLLVGRSLLIARPGGQLMKMPVEIMHGVFENFLVPVSFSLD